MPRRRRLRHAPETLRPTVMGDCLFVASYIDRHGDTVADPDIAQQMADEFRHPTAETLITNVDCLLGCAPQLVDARVVWAAQRLQALIDSYTRTALAALLNPSAA